MWGIKLAAPELLIISAVIGGIALAFSNAKKEAQEYEASQERMQSLLPELERATADVRDTTNEWAYAISKVGDEMMAFIVPKTAEEAKMLADIAEQEGIVADTKIGEGERSLQFEEAKLERMRLVYDAEYAAKRNFATAWMEFIKIKAEEEKGVNADITAKTRQLYSSNYEGIKTMLTTEFYPAVKTEADKFKEEEVARWKAIQDEIDITIKKQSEYLAREKAGAGMYVGGIGKQGISAQGVGIKGLSASSTKKDFIMRPGQDAVSFSSGDTIVGAKGGGLGGISITITGNIYGTNPDEIAEALVDKLRRKIAL